MYWEFMSSNFSRVIYPIVKKVFLLFSVLFLGASARAVSLVFLDLGPVIFVFLLLALLHCGGDDGLERLELLWLQIEGRSFLLLAAVDRELDPDLEIYWPGLLVVQLDAHDLLAAHADGCHFPLCLEHSLRPKRALLSVAGPLQISRLLELEVALEICVLLFVSHALEVVPRHLQNLFRRRGVL